MNTIVRDIRGKEVPKLYAHDSHIFKRMEGNEPRYYGPKGEEIPVASEELIELLISFHDRLQKVIDLLPMEEYKKYGIIFEEMLNSHRMQLVDIFNYIDLLYGKIEIRQCQEGLRKNRIVDVLLIENRQRED